MGELTDDQRAAARVGIGTLAFSVLVFILYPAPVSTLVLGAILGMLSALIAMGIVLIYRANRIVNFAQGDLGALAASLAASLIVGPKWNFWPAVLVGLLVAVGVGALVEFTIIRRFTEAPRLILTVATIGLAQLFAFAQLGIPLLFDFDTTPQPPEPFNLTLEWFPNTFRGGHILIALLVPAVGVGLSVFFRRSRIGVAIRASAESQSRAALLGIPTKRINTVVWMLASGMSGLAVLLRMPVQGVAIGETLGPSLLLRALAAAVIGRMESLPRTFFAAVAIGIIQEAAFFVSGDTSVVDFVVFLIVIAGLLAQRASNERARDTGEGLIGTGEIRPIPRELIKLPEVRIGLGVVVAAVGVFLLYMPLTWGVSATNRFTVGVIYAIIMVSLVPLMGWSGQITLGALAVSGFGAAVGGTLFLQGKDFFVCLLAAAITGAVVAVLLGIPALRVGGLFFAVTTLAFAVATGTYLLNPRFNSWLVPEDVRPLRPVIFDKFDLESEYTYYFVVLFFFLLVVTSLMRIRKSRTGRMLIARRDNTRAAASYGISPKRAQLTAFAIHGFIAGGGGALFYFHQRSLSASLLEPARSITFVVIAVTGGLSTVVGALIGAAYFTFVSLSDFAAEPRNQFFASSVGLLFVLLVFPAGLGGAFYKLRDRLLRSVARSRDIVVPSLLADVRTDESDRPGASDPAPEPAALTSVPGDTPHILVRDLEVAYGKTQVLFGVDFHVERHEIVALLGTNGAGKSTLLNAMTGLVQPFAGTVEYDGADITRADPQDIVRSGMVLMPGGKGVFPTLTVRENLELAGWIHDDDPEYVESAIEDVLTKFPRLRERYHQKAGNLSGGEQQMLTLGQAFILKPDLLLIDELSLGLAPIIVEQLLGIVKEIHAAGSTIVVVEQSVNVAITLAERAVFMEKGEVRFDGPTAELLERPEILRAVFLQGADAKDELEAPAGPDRVVEVRERQPFVAHCDNCGRDHPTLLELDEVSISFGGVRAVNGVSFSVMEGQIVGMIGPNGAGKTTVFDLISGFLVPSAGRVRFAGQDVTDFEPDARAMLGLGRSFQDARLFTSMTVRETIATALERHVKVRDPLAAALMSPAVVESEKFVAEEVDELIELMNLEAFADKFVGELSTGSRRIVDLACSLAHRPSVLLLDEPSSGIAQRETEALGPVLFDIRDKTGAALVVIEHDMPLITSISDELIALELGSVIARGEPEAVVTDSRVVQGYLGQTAAVINRSGGDGRVLDLDVLRHEVDAAIEGAIEGADDNDDTLEIELPLGPPEPAATTAVVVRPQPGVQEADPVETPPVAAPKRRRSAAKKSAARKATRKRVAAKASAGERAAPRKAAKKAVRPAKRRRVLRADRDGKDDRRDDGDDGDAS